MSKIVFLELRLFRNNMIETYQINQLRESGHEVEIWHLGGIFEISGNVILSAPALKDYAVMITSLDELKGRVQKLETNTILFSMLGLLHYYPILYKIIKSRKDLIWIGRITKSLPLGSRKRVHPLKSVLGNIFFFKLYKPLSNVLLYVSQKVIRKYGFRIGVRGYQPDYLMVSNANQVVAGIPEDKVIVTHADDYNIHLLNKDIEVDPSLQDAIVFLDQMLYYHPDFKKLGENMTDVDGYYQNLNKILDDLSEKYGKPVIIAGHPEADKHPQYRKRFQSKKFIVGKSMLLVKHAALVVSHYSTAVNFAVINDKPLLLLSSNGFENYEKIMTPIKVLSKALNVPVINIDDYNLQSINPASQPDYRVYKNSYIKSDNTPEELSYPYVINYVSNRTKSKSPVKAL